MNGFCIYFEFNHKMFALAEKQASYGDTEVNQSQRDSNTSLQHDAVELS